MRPLNWDELYRILWNHHNDLEWSTKDDTCIRLYGYVELNFATMNEGWKADILRAAETGLRNAVKPPWVRVLDLFAQYAPNPTRISYLGRQEAKLYYPTEKAKEYVEQLNTIYKLESGTTREPFSIFYEDDHTGLMYVRAKLRQKGAGKGVAPKAFFTRMRKPVQQQLEECRYHRQPFYDWLKTEPLIKLPMSSHDHNWQRR